MGTPSTKTVAIWAGAVVLVAAALYALIGTGYLGYDAAYALVWGDDLAHGDVPNFDRPFAPTPHPLANLVGMALSAAGGSAPVLAAVLALVWMAVLAVAAFDFGRTLFSAEAGVLFVLLLLTRPLLVAEVLHVSADIQFLAIVMVAAAIQARRRGPGPAPISLLVVAGLLRPEAWALALFYAIWWSRQQASPRTLLLVAAVAAAPLMWMLFDLLATGEPFHSLQGTRELAEQLDRPRFARTAFASVSPYLDAALGTEVVIVGLLGVIATLWLAFDRAVLPAAIAAVGLGAFFVLALFGLPVLSRYLLLPSAMLAFFAAAAIVGWRVPELAANVRRAWIAGAVAAVALVAVGALDTRESLRHVPQFAQARRDLQDDLRDVVEHGVKRRCDTVLVESYRVAPLVAYWSGGELDGVEIERPGDRSARAEIVRAASDEAAADYVFDASEATAQRSPARAREVARNASWAVYDRC